MTLLRYRGLELPIYEAGADVVCTPEDFVAIPQRSGDFCLRLVGIKVPEDGTLLSYLKDTDEELELAADACKAEVVEHSWGLWSTEDTKIPSRIVDPEGIVPVGFKLISRVAIIDELAPPNYAAWNNELIQGLANDYPANNRLLGKRVKLSDLATQQFIWGISRPDQSNKPKRWLGDIEPRLKKN